MKPRKINFIVECLGDSSVGLMGTTRKVEVNIDDDFDSDEQEEHFIDQMKTTLENVFGDDSKTNVYEEKELQMLISIYNGD